MGATQPEIRDGFSATGFPVRHPDVLIYALWALFSTLLIAVAVRDYYHGGGGALWKPLLWEGSSVLFGTVLLTLQRTAGRRYDPYLDEPAKWFWMHLKWLPLYVLSFIGAVYGARHAVYALFGETYTHEPWKYVFPYEAMKIGLFTGLWLGVIFGFDSFARWQARQRHLLELERALAESRLAALGAQLRPHFFFNALNTISALMHLDVSRADRLLTRLGDLLRASLQPAGQTLMPLREELQLLDLYAQIMLERFADRVTLDWHIDENTLALGVPTMLLQPLLENAFKHAVERGREKVHMEITAVRDGEALMLTIRNTASSLPVDFRDGVGLRNCRERLQVIYGDRATARLSEQADGVHATITVPCQAITDSVNAP